METVSETGADFWEQFETFQSVSVDLARFMSSTRWRTEPWSWRSTSASS